MQPSFGQNIIPLGDFEGDELAIGNVWKQPNGAYFHYQYGENEFISPHSGMACNGICIIGNAPTEYLQVKLKEPLIAGEKYVVNFFVRGYSLRAFKMKRLDSIGIFFSNTPQELKDRTQILVEPQLKFAYDITQPLDFWQEVSIMYQAEGEENYLTLGRFLETEANDYDEIQALEEQLVDLKETYYEKVKMNFSSGSSYMIPGVRPTRKQKKKEKKDTEMQLERYAMYTHEKKQLEDKIIQWYKSQGSQTYQVRLYFDDFCMRNINGDPCVQTELYVPNEQVHLNNGLSASMQEGDTIVLRNVYFDLDKSSLKKESFAELNLLTDILVSYQEMEISIEGHTDSQGEASYNVTLSENRAEAVKNFLIESGIESFRLHTKGFGEGNTLNKSNTEQAHAENRRVEVIVLKK